MLVYDVILVRIKFILSAGSEGSRIGSCKLREARSLISSVVNPGYPNITLKARDNKLDLSENDFV